MNLTSRGRPTDIIAASSRAARRWTAVVVPLALLLIFWLDIATGDTPVQHLYYAPIVLAAAVFGWSGGLLTSLAAVALYHAANFQRILSHYGEADAIQVALFVAMGLVTARLVADARRLRHLAMTDDLTGLHNLRSFEARLGAIIAESEAVGAPVSMLVIDVDRLKAINDAHGHLTGADAVRTIGGLIAATVPGDAVACRYGGDEFAVVLPGRDGPDAIRAAERLRERVRAAAPDLAGRAFPAGTLSVSVGVATWPQRGVPAAPADVEGGRSVGEALFRAADTALYAAKAGGRNQVVSERWDS